MVLEFYARLLVGVEAFIFFRLAYRCYKPNRYTKNSFLCGKVNRKGWSMCLALSIVLNYIRSSLTLSSSCLIQGTIAATVAYSTTPNVTLRRW